MAGASPSTGKLLLDKLRLPAAAKVVRRSRWPGRT
jgi:hypothetical protein